MSAEARHLVIRASAGSGKTFQLSTRYLKRLVAGTPANEILATTFTRKAAGEILERVLLRLANAANDGTAAKELAQDLGADELRQADFQRLLVELTQQLHRLQVGTLDSFFARLATNFTLELGLPPGWEIVDELFDQQLRSQAIADVLREDTTADIMRLTSLLAKGQAGRSVSVLIRQTIQEFYSLFRETNAAAWQQLHEGHRLTKEQLTEAIEALQVAQLPADKRANTARDKDVQAALDGNWESFIQSGLGATLLRGVTTYYKKPIPEATQRLYGRLLDHAREGFVQELAQQTRATWQLMERFEIAYRRLKWEHRSLRFDDITHRLRELFAVGDPGQLAYRLNGQVRHLLLDEFQDTSPAQWQVLRPLAKQITSAESDSSFFCVGDAKQSIFAWRGGLAEIFNALDEELSNLQSSELTKSYRSSQPVIDTVNCLFEGLTRHPQLGSDAAAIREWCNAFEKHTTAKAELPGYACVVGEEALQSDDDKPGSAVLTTAARKVADIVREAPWASVGVLLRKNAEIMKVMNELRKIGVPASEEGGNPITDSAAVLTILSLMTFADHPGDTVARFHLANSPAGTLLSLTDYTDDTEAATVAASLRQLLMAEGYGPVIDHWSHDLASACTSRERMRMRQLVELGYRFDAEGTLRPTDFVRFVKHERFSDPSTDRVRVMTIHAAKGLQFDVVVAPLLPERNLTGQNPEFVSGRDGPTGEINRVCLYRNQFVQSLLPNEFQQIFAMAKSREIRETLCRLYVTVTRAIHALYVIVPTSSSKEKSLPKNPAGLVRAALTDGRPVLPDQIVYKKGDRGWSKKFSETSNENLDAKEQITDRKPIETKLCVRLANMPTGRERGLVRVAPSRHETREPVRLRQVLQSGNAVALSRGTLIHAWFEQITWLEDGLPTDEELRRVAAGLGEDADAIGRELPAFRRMLEQPQIIRLLSRTSYGTRECLPFSASINETLLTGEVECVVRPELPVAARQQGELATGFIDRLVLLRRGTKVLAADIIDFKTDAVDPKRESDWSARIAHYQPQLMAYGNAIAQIYDLPTVGIAARLAFVEPGVVVNVSLD